MITPYTAKTAINNGTTATTIVLDKPGHLENDGILLVCITLVRAVASITWSTPPTGFTLLTNVGNNPVHAAWYYKPLSASGYNAASEPSTYTFNWTGGSRVAASIVFIKDVDVADIIEGFNTASATSNGSDTSTVTPTNNGCLILKYHCNDNAGGVAISNPTGYTEVLNFQSGTGAASAEQALSYNVQTTAAAAGAASWGMTASDQWIGCTIAINAKAGSAIESALVSNTIKYSNIPNTFERDSSTFDEDGDEVAANVIRYGKPIYYMPTLNWENLMTLNSNISHRASGLDYDNKTPITAWYRSDNNTHYFYKGTTLMNSFTGDDFMEGSLSSTYKWTPGIFIYHGIIIFQCERFVSGVLKGVGIIISKDYGATFERVEAVGGGDIPIISGDVSSGMERGQRWSLTGGFPTTEGSELTSVFITCADYLAKADNPQGGQILLFKITRPSTTGEWEASPIREIYQYWEVGASGVGTHAHTAAICSEGVISWHGDVGYRNRGFIHMMDLSDYENATINTYEISGGFSNTNTIYKESPQPVGALPGAVFGTHFAAGDESSPAVGLYEWDSTNNCVKITTVGEEVRNTLGGSTWDGSNYLASSMCKSKRLVTPFYSPDGIKWARTPGSLRFYGDSYFLRNQSGQIQIAKIPAIETVYPVCINPGGRNILDQMTQLSAPGTNVVVEQVYWDEETNEYRKVVGDTLLDPQPPPGPWDNSTIFYLFSNGTTGSRTGGGYQLSSVRIDTNTNKAFNICAFNMAVEDGLNVDPTQGFSLTYQSGATNNVDTEKGYVTAENQKWVDFSEICDPSTKERNPARINLYLGASSSNTYPNVKTLIAFKGISDSDSISYPIKNGILADLPDEILKFTLPSAAQWSYNGIFYYPSSCKGVVDATYGTPRVFCTLYEDANNHIEISARTVGTIRFAVTIGGSTTNHDISVGQSYSPAGLYWGDLIEVFVRTSGSNMVLYAKVGYDSTFTSATTTGQINPVEAKICNKNETIVQDIKLLGNFYWEKEQDISLLYKTLGGRLGRLSSSLMISSIITDIISEI